MTRSPLQQIIGGLKKRYGKPSAPLPRRDPLAYLYFEALAYLRPETERLEAFRALRDRVGLAPRSLLKAPVSVLTTICRIGGIMPDLRAKRLREIAALALERFDGDVTTVLAWDYAKARRALQEFPMVGESGADRILMLCGFPGVFGFQSNEHRTLNRLGYGEELKNYSKSYRLTRDAALAELPNRNAALVEASLLLRLHGQETCKTSAPRCEECPLTSRCAWFATHAR